MEESRDLLILATSRFFTNLTRLHPFVDLSVRTPAVQKAAEEYAAKFNQVEVDDDEDDGEEGAADEGDA